MEGPPVKSPGREVAKGRLAAAAAAACLLVPMALCAQTTGDLGGLVMDGTGESLPGATVTLESPSLLGGELFAISDRLGRFEFPGLPPGRYTVTADLEGFAAQKVENLEVHLKQATELRIELSPSRIRDEIEVVSRTPVIDPTKVSQGHLFDQEYLENAPIGMVARRYLGVIKQAPGVVDAVRCADDVDPNIFGSIDNENLYLLDGASITLPGNMTWGQMVNFDAIEEISLETAGYEAEYGATTGGVVSLVTKSGGDELSGSVDLRSGSSDWSENGEHFDRDEEPFRDETLSFTLGGPLAARKAWFFVAAQGIDSEWTPTNTESTVNFEGHNLLGKLTWQMAPSWTLVGQYSKDPASIHNFNASPFVEPEATDRWEQGGVLARTEVTGVLTRRLMWRSQASLYEPDSGTRAESGDLTTIGHYEFNPSPRRWGNATRLYEFDRRREAIETDWLLMAGSHHSIKSGLEYEEESQSFEQYLLTGYEYWDAFGAPYGLLWAPRQGVSTVSGKRFGAFAQDSWRVLPRLNLSLGVRWDRTAQEGSAGRRVAEMEMLQPRLGFTWQATGDGKTIVRASWGRFMLPNSLQLVQVADHQSGYLGPELYYLSCGRFGLSREQCREWRPGQVTVGEHTVDRWIPDPGEDWEPAGFWLSEWYLGSEDGLLVDPDLQPMFAEQLVVGIEREFAARSSIELSYVDKVTEDIFEDTCSGNLPVPSQDADCDAFVIANLPQLERTYRGWILRLRSRARPWLHLVGSYTWARSLGNVQSGGAGDDFDLYPEHWENRYGYLSDDRRHRARLNGYFLLPHGFTLALEAGWMSEFPYSVIEPIWPWGGQYREPRGSRRAGENYWLNLQLAKSFEIGRARLYVIGSALNVLGDEQVTFVCNNYYGCSIDDVDYEVGEPLYYTQPRHYEVGLRVEF